MKYVAFKMKLKPGYAKEYERRHDAIWPELRAELCAVGILNYAIFLDEETLTLFAYQELTDDHHTDQLPASPIVQRWWDAMADIMETEPNNVPVCAALREVFLMDGRDERQRNSPDSEEQEP